MPVYDSDSPDAKPVGVEVIVSPATYQTFSVAEKDRWHYHKTEIPKVSATLPDLSPEEAAKVVKEIEGTYGVEATRVYLEQGCHEFVHMQAEQLLECGDQRARLAGQVATAFDSIGRGVVMTSNKA